MTTNPAPRTPPAQHKPVAMHSPDAAGTINIQQLVSRLRFRHLRLLLELERGGSLRAASVILNLTQPALGKALDEVEQAFGFALFERSPRGLKPTARGEVALRGATLLLAELSHLGEEVAATRVQMLLRIGAPPFVAQSFLPPVLQRLTTQYPSLQVRLREAQVALLFKALEAGELDALISSYPMDMSETSARAFSYEKLFASEFFVIAPAGHPMAKAKAVTWPQLSQAAWVMPERNSMVRRVLEDAFRREACIPPEPVVESTSPYTNLQLVSAGIGLSAVPAEALQSMPSAKNVRRVNVVPAIRANTVALIVRKGPADPRLAGLRWALGLQAA